MGFQELVDRLTGGSFFSGSIQPSCAFPSGRDGLIFGLCPCELESFLKFVVGNIRKDFHRVTKCGVVNLRLAIRTNELFKSTLPLLFATRFWHDRVNHSLTFQIQCLNQFCPKFVSIHGFVEFQ